MAVGLGPYKKTTSSGIAKTEQQQEQCPPETDLYRGSWVMNLRHGQGTNSYVNGDCYNGEWRRGLQDRHWRYQWKNKNHYIGQWKNGMMNGNRSFYVGVWSKDPKEQNDTYYPSTSSGKLKTYEQVMPAFMNVMNEDSTLVTLVKPQFEARRSQVGRGGIVRDLEVHQEVLEKIINGIERYGFTNKGFIGSTIKGTEGK